VYEEHTCTVTIVEVLSIGYVTRKSRDTVAVKCPADALGQLRLHSSIYTSFIHRITNYTNNKHN